MIIDLSAYSSNYLGGVSTYSLGVTQGILYNIPKGWTVSLISTEDIHLPNSENVKTIRIERTIRNKLTNFAHRINYNLFKSYILFFIIRKFELSKHYKKSFSNTIIYTPTTYLNSYINNSINIVSLHDCQEKKFPEYFSKKQILYRKFNCKYTLDRAKLIQVSSQFIKNEILHYFKDETTKTQFFIIAEGVDTEVFKKAQTRNENEKFTIFLPSSFHAHKNHKDIFKALELLDNSNLIEVVLTGEGPELEHYKREATKFLNVKFNFIGYVSRMELVQNYQKANLVVVTSEYESSSLPILEAISCGTKVIASDIPPHKEMKLKLPFELYRLHNQYELSSKIENEIRIQKREINSEYAIPNYDWNFVGDEYWKIFEEII